MGGEVTIHIDTYSKKNTTQWCSSTSFKPSGSIFSTRIRTCNHMQKPATQRTEAWTNIFATLLRCLTSQEIFGGSSIGEFSLHKWLKKGETLLPRSEKRMKRHGTGTGHWGQVFHINFKFDHSQPSSKMSLDLSLMPSRNISLSLCIALYLSVYQANYIPLITYVSPPGTPQPLEQAGSSHSSTTIYLHLYLPVKNLYVSSCFRLPDSLFGRSHLRTPTGQQLASLRQWQMPSLGTVDQYGS